MKLSSVQVLGFQSFGDSGEVELSEGINLLVGQNNSGKSSLLRALQPSLIDDRHHSPEVWEDFRLPTPQVSLDVEVSGAELRKAILKRGSAHIPIPTGEDPGLYIINLLGRNKINVNIIHKPGQRFTATYPGHGQFSSRIKDPRFCAVVQTRDGKLEIHGENRDSDNVADMIFDLWEEQTFHFSAERMNIGESNHSHVPRLSSNANNLPAFLLTLSGDRGDIFRKLVGHIRDIFPTVGNVSVRPTPNTNMIEVRIWPTEAMERVELSFPLMRSGTGVSQVLAILAAVMTVEDSIIIIDEINSFLHPAAVKALIRILKTEYGGNQYIISTHSPDVISFSLPRTIHLVKRNGYESRVERLNGNSVDEFREVAELLGVSMADVFAADRVIWVEGPTEELCFPLLYQKSAGHPLPRGTIFTSVMATGDFMSKRRDKELIYKIYNRLSHVSVPLVVSVAFSFDSEKLSETDKEQMVRDSQGAMHFLPRRHIECYLVNPAAIADFLAEGDAVLAGVVSAENVMHKLIELAGTERFKVAEWSGDLRDVNWLARVDAANLIAETCAQISEARVTFNKKHDTLTLLQRVQAEDEAQVEELTRYVRGLVEAVT